LKIQCNHLAAGVPKNLQQKYIKLENIQHLSFNDLFTGELEFASCLLILLLHAFKTKPLEISGNGFFYGPTVSKKHKPLISTRVNQQLAHACIIRHQTPNSKARLLQLCWFLLIQCLIKLKNQQNNRFMQQIYANNIQK